jgi:valyl-tRNA synthetase
VLDERGDKMSKSKGNGIDPIIMIDGGVQNYLGKDYQCPGYGADAMRYTLLDMTTEGQDLKLSPTRFETGRNFANKVWNAGRFLLMNLSERPFNAPVTGAFVMQAQLGFVERWLLDRLQAAIAACTEALENFRFNDYANTAYHFFRDDLCDWYLEWAKRQFKVGGPQADAAAKVLYYALDQSLRLLHPGMPYITEFMWQQLQQTSGGQAWASNQFLMLNAWPTPLESMRNATLGARMTELQQIVSAVRNIRNQQGLADGVRLHVTVGAPSPDKAAKLKLDQDFIVDRANLESLNIGYGLPKPGASVTEVVGELKIHVWLQGVIDMATLKVNLSKRLVALEKSAAGKQARLANADYAARAPAAQVQETRDMLAKELLEISTLKETLAGL